MVKNNIKDPYLSKTRMAYTWTRILNTPFWALYILLPFIILKDLHATSWQIACIISFKPMVSLFSLYWSAQIKRRRDRLRSNIIWANILGHIPFLFVPFVNHPWYFVFASTVYMLFWRGVNPAWMEILKINVPEESRHHVFAYGSAFYHVGGAVLAIVMGWLLDDYYQAWRWLFPLAAIISCLAIFFQINLPLRISTENIQDPLPTFFSFAEEFKKPWKDAWNLLCDRPDFARFQIGFLLAGGGLMLWKPAEPLFFMETLKLNYKELSIAITLCKSIGYTLALPLWTRAIKQVDLFVFCSLVTTLTAIFPLGLLAAQWNLIFLYGAYLLYGMMQAGSELSWNLSGPIFARNEDSSTYSGVNVVTVGLRGCIAPPLGSLLCNLTNAMVVLLIGGGVSLLATWQMYSNRSLDKTALTPKIQEN
jgi:hypothetical protein